MSPPHQVNPRAPLLTPCPPHLLGGTIAGLHEHCLLAASFLGNAMAPPMTPI